MSRRLAKNPTLSAGTVERMATQETIVLETGLVGVAGRHSWRVTTRLSMKVLSLARGTSNAWTFGTFAESAESVLFDRLTAPYILLCLTRRWKGIR